MLTGLAASAQCMWWNTQRVGMGVSEDINGGMIVVAKYDPEGNL